MPDMSGGKVTPISTSPIGAPTSQGYQISTGMSAPFSGYSGGIVQGNGADWFGPLNPMAPAAPVEVRGRAFDFPSGYNLSLTPRTYDGISFGSLRAMADGYDILRLVIETRKDVISTLPWAIKPRPVPGTPREKMADPTDPRIRRLSEFFVLPDGEHTWDQWVRLMLEDMLVLDAPTLFIERTRGGRPAAFQVIDGGTIKRVIDDWGRTPAYPAPAFQQVLKGMPAVNYTTEDIIYRPRNPRPNKVYGYSPVEQIIMTVNIALRRQLFFLQYYTEGNVPEALIGAPENWNMTQIKEFQTWFDSILAGETGARRRARFVPGGIGKTYINTKEGALTNDSDEWLTRICCYAFSVPPTPFIRSVNRATADNQMIQAKEEGSLPVQQWVTNLMNYIIWKVFGYRDLEFSFRPQASVNSEQQAKTFDIYLKNGTMSHNQVLTQLGEDPIEDGDQHMALLPTGWVPIAPTNQFGASGGNQGVGEVDDKVKEEGNQPQEGQGDKKPEAPPEPSAKVKKLAKMADIPFWERVKAMQD